MFNKIHPNNKLDYLVTMFVLCDGDQDSFVRSMGKNGVGESEAIAMYMLCAKLKSAEVEINLLRMVCETPKQNKVIALIQNGWEGANGLYVKTEWLTADPSSYEYMTLNDAYLMHLRELEVK